MQNSNHSIPRTNLSIHCHRCSKTRPWEVANSPGSTGLHLRDHLLRFRALCYQAVPTKLSKSRSPTALIWPFHYHNPDSPLQRLGALVLFISWEIKNSQYQKKKKEFTIYLCSHLRNFQPQTQSPLLFYLMSNGDIILVTWPSQHPWALPNIAPSSNSELSGRCR